MDTDVLLQHIADADTPDEYVQRQSDSISSLAGHHKQLCAIAADSSAPLRLRFEALQALFWLAPADIESFLLRLTALPDDSSDIAEAARALLFRWQVRRTVAAEHPERLQAYLDATQREYAEWLFSANDRNA